MKNFRINQTLQFHRDGFPGLDFDGKTLSEIRDRVRGRRSLRPFQNNQRVDVISEAIAELGAKE